MKAWCLFEQSGTFKNQFKKFGFDAVDVDIQNEFGETDYVLDLFSEINAAFEGGRETIFDSIGEDDIVMAFFPCTRFESRVPLLFRGESYQQKNHTTQQKLEYSLKLHDELHELYTLLCKMCIVALKKKIKMVIENPATQPHYLTSYFPIRPSLIDKDRHANGDYFKKPTQYFFLNFKPQANFLMEAVEYQKLEKIYNPHICGMSRQTSRSMIHPNYARRFIYNNVLTKEQAKQALERGSK